MKIPLSKTIQVQHPDDWYLIDAAPSLLEALGLCLTALSFELEQAQKRDDIIAGRQIAAAIKAGRAAIAKSQGEVP